MKRLVTKKMIPVKDFWNIASRGLLMLLLLFVCGVNAANAADTFKYLNNEYKITSDDACEMTSSSASNSDPIIVPDEAYDTSTQKSYKVTSIANNACKSYTGTKVVIGDNVQTIGNKAFEHFGEHDDITLILGKGIKALDGKSFEHLGEHKGCKVFCTSKFPPTIVKESFEHVKNTVFYVLNESVYDKYKAAENWCDFDGKKGNSYKYPFPYNYELDKKWMTFVGPEDMDASYIESVFGHDTKVAYLRSASWDASQNQYNLVFDETTTIKANTPYFIKPTRKETSYYTEESCKAGDVNCTKVSVEGKSDYYANMIGNVSEQAYYLAINEFYFRNMEYGTYFYIAKEEKKNFVNPYKCYFRITKSESSDPVLAKVAMFMDFDDDTPTGITEVEASAKLPKGIYDIHGMYRGNSLQNLPKGLYIVNGKKIIK